MDGITVRIVGIEEMKAALASIAPKLRKGALVRVMREAMRIVRDEARRAAPRIAPGADSVRRGYRKPGTLRRAISVRTSSADRKQGNVGVFVNVRPAKKGKRGAKSQNDPFYWRFLEFGWNPASNALGGRTTKFGKAYRRSINRRGKAVAGVRFLRDAAKKLPAVLPRFIAGIGPVIQSLNRRNAPTPR